MNQEIVQSSSRIREITVATVCSPEMRVESVPGYPGRGFRLEGAG